MTAASPTRPRGGNVEQFDADGYETSLTYPTGQAWTFTYTTAGGLDTILAPDGGVTTFSYNADTGLLSSITEPGSRTLTFSDTGTDLTGIVDVDGSTRTLGYSSHLLTTDNWAPWATTFGYDTTGRVDAVDLGGVQPYTVSPANSDGVATITDNYGNTTSYTLDSLGHLLAEQEPGNVEQTWVYDSNGQVVSSTDARDQTTTYEYAYGPYDTTVYGGDGDLIQVTDTNGQTQTYRYDPVYNQVTQETDEAGDVTVYGYDTYGDLASTTTAYGTLAAATSTSTWSGGLLTSSIDADGNVTDYTYNSLDQETAQVTSDTDRNVIDQEAFTYDAAGFTATTQVGDPAFATSATTYDGKGQLLEQTDPSGTRTFTTYTAAGFVQSSTDGRGVLTSYVYNGAGEQVEQIADANQLVPERSYTDYDQDGNVTETVDAAGNYVVNVYNADGEVVTSTSYDHGGTLIGYQTYSYDADGNVLTQTSYLTSTTWTLTSNSYDALDRLVYTVTVDTSGHVLSSQATTYDGDNNVLTEVDYLTASTWILTSNTYATPTPIW